MGKNKDGKNPLYKGEAGICKGCNENQPSILRHTNKTKNKTCSKFYTDNDYNILRLQSRHDPDKKERLRILRRKRYLADKGKKPKLHTAKNLKLTIKVLTYSLTKMINQSLSEIQAVQNM